SRGPRQRHAAARRKGLCCAGWRRDAHPAQRLTPMLTTALILGAVAALADVAGGLVLVRARGIDRYLRYFVALGAGFLIATALLEMTPDSIRVKIGRASCRER